MENRVGILETAVSSRKKLLFALILLIFFSGLLNVLLYLLGFYSISADESGRTLLAYQWLHNGYKETPTWLPFYTAVIGYGIKIVPDLFWTPRVIATILGVLSFTSFIWLVHYLFKDRYITLLSAVIALFFPTRVILSAVPLSESMYYFFVFSGIALFTMWLRSKWDHNLILSALAFAVSSSVRYEGWFFSAALVVILIIFKSLKVRDISITNILLISLIGASFPLYWFLFQTNISGNPLQFFEDAKRGYENAQGITFFTILKNNYLVRFIHHNIIYLCFPGLISSGYLFVKDGLIRRWIGFLLLPFIPLLILSFFGIGIPTHNIWRVPELWNILLIPFTAYFIKNIGTLEIKYFRHLQRIKIPLLLTLLLIYYSFHVYRLTGANAFTKEDLKVGRYVEKSLMLDERNKILIEIPDWTYLNIIVASNKPKFFVLNSNFNPRIKGNEIINKDHKINFEELSNRHIKYLVFKSEKLKNKVMSNPFFRKKKGFSQWSVFEL
jgi:hypothetical protein